MKDVEKIAQLLLQAKTKSSMVKLVLGLLTEKEIEEIGRRIEIIRMLQQGLAQHMVAERLGVGVATVTRGAREIRLKRFDEMRK